MRENEIQRYDELRHYISPYDDLVMRNAESWAKNAVYLDAGRHIPERLMRKIYLGSMEIVVNLPEHMVILKHFGREIARAQTDKIDWNNYDPEKGVLLCLVKAFIMSYSELQELCSKAIIISSGGRVQ